MPSRLSLLAALCASLFSTSPAMAQSSSAHASVSALTWHLVDLDLTDSITPAMSLLTEHKSSTSYYRDSGPYGYEELHDFGATSITHPAGSASTNLTPSTLDAQASYGPPGAAYQQLVARTQYALQFQLTPMTRVVFHANASMDAAQDSADTWSAASVTMSGLLVGAGGTIDDLFDVALETDGAPAFGMLSGQLDTGAQAGYASFDIVANATAFGPAPLPVPEPSTYAMLAAGMLVVGWRIRRMRHSSGAHATKH